MTGNIVSEDNNAWDILAELQDRNSQILDTKINQINAFQHKPLI